jgi:hypothetical protein
MSELNFRPPGSYSLLVTCQHIGNRYKQCPASTSRGFASCETMVAAGQNHAETYCNAGYRRCTRSRRTYPLGHQRDAQGVGCCHAETGYTVEGIVGSCSDPPKSDVMKAKERTKELRKEGAVRPPRRRRRVILAMARGARSTPCHNDTEAYCNAGYKGNMRSKQRISC